MSRKEKQLIEFFKNQMKPEMEWRCFGDKDCSSCPAEENTRDEVTIEEKTIVSEVSCNGMNWLFQTHEGRTFSIFTNPGKCHFVFSNSSLDELKNFSNCLSAFIDDVESESQE